MTIYSLQWSEILHAFFAGNVLATGTRDKHKGNYINNISIRNDKHESQRQYSKKQIYILHRWGYE